MEHTFEALGLRAALCEALAKQGITAPTEIQQKMIPEILSGKDFGFFNLCQLKLTFSFVFLFYTVSDKMSNLFAQKHLRGSVSHFGKIFKALIL